MANNKTLIESGQKTINEIRREEGDLPLEWGDQPLVAANLITLDRVVKGQTGGKTNEP